MVTRSSSTPSTPTPSGERSGALLGIIAFAVWGLFPLFFAALAPAGAIEVLAHRIVWAFLVCLVAVSLLRRWGRVRTLLTDPGSCVLLVAAAVLIATNWGVYVHAVGIGHVLDASLGYFINPLVTVLIAVVVLRERLRPVQWVAIGIGLVAVAVLTVELGRPPWISLTLAFSFGLYGLLKNKLARRAGGGVDALTGLAAETTVLTPLAVVGLVVLHAQHTATFGAEGVGHAVLLVVAGPLTVVPLLLFALAAGRVSLSTIGLVQYLTPVLQLLCGLWLGERMLPAQWIGFGLIWVALALLSADALRSAGRAGGARA